RRAAGAALGPGAAARARVPGSGRAGVIRLPVAESRRARRGADRDRLPSGRHRTTRRRDRWACTELTLLVASFDRGRVAGFCAPTRFGAAWNARPGALSVDAQERALRAVLPLTHVAACLRSEHAAARGPGNA